MKTSSHQTGLSGSIIKEPSYYIVAHASKFVRPNSVRIASIMLEKLPNVAYTTPSGKTVLIVLNEDEKAQTFRLSSGSQSFTAYLEAGSVATYVW